MHGGDLPTTNFFWNAQHCAMHPRQEMASQKKKKHINREGGADVAPQNAERGSTRKTSRAAFAATRPVSHPCHPAK